MEPRKVQECLLELFTVYQPNQQGLPRKYLVRDDCFYVFEHNTMKAVTSLPLEEKEVIWFNAWNLLGEQFITDKLRGYLASPSLARKSVETPIKPVRNRRTFPVKDRLSGSPKKAHNPFSIAQLEKLSSSPAPPRLSTQPFPEQDLPFTRIEGQTQDVGLEVALEAVRQASQEEPALQAVVKALDLRCPGYTWQVKPLSVGLLFGSPRVVLTDFHNIYVVSGVPQRRTSEQGWASSPRRCGLRCSDWSRMAGSNDAKRGATVIMY